MTTIAPATGFITVTDLFAHPHDVRRRIGDLGLSPEDRAATQAHEEVIDFFAYRRIRLPGRLGEGQRTPLWCDAALDDVRVIAERSVESAVAVLHAACALSVPSPPGSVELAETMSPCWALAAAPHMLLYSVNDAVVSILGVFTDREQRRPWY